MMLDKRISYLEDQSLVTCIIDNIPNVLEEEFLQTVKIIERQKFTQKLIF